MSRFSPDAPVAVHPTTGEVLDMMTVNSRLVALADELEKVQPKLAGLLDEQQRVCLRYDLVFAASVVGSEQRSEDRRRAEATLHLSTVHLDDSPVDLATRRSVLEMQVKALREASHNIRAAMSGLQTVASNLRAELTIGGVRP